MDWNFFERKKSNLPICTDINKLQDNRPKKKKSNSNIYERKVEDHQQITKPKTKKRNSYKCCELKKKT